MKLKLVLLIGNDNIKDNIIKKMKLSKKAKIEKVYTDKTNKADDMSDSDLFNTKEKLSEKLQSIIKDVTPGLSNLTNSYSLY